MENVSEPDFDISSRIQCIDTAKELLLSKPQSSATPDVKKSKEFKLALYEICFPNFYFSSVVNVWLCKICCLFSHGIAGFRITLIQIAINYLWKTSNAFKKCPIEMSMFGKWYLMHLYSSVKLNVKIIVLFWNASLK